MILVLHGIDNVKIDCKFLSFDFAFALECTFLIYKVCCEKNLCTGVSFECQHAIEVKCKIAENFTV